MARAKGRWIQCSYCGGHGVVSGYTFSGDDFLGAEECRHCSSGRIWRYPSGALALYPGGPLCGRDESAKPRKRESGRAFVRRVAASNPTFSQRAAKARGATS